MDSENQEKKYLICPVCHKANSADVRFCQYCWGAVLNPDEPYSEDELEDAILQKTQVRGRKRKIRLGILGALLLTVLVFAVLYTINYTDIISKPSPELTSDATDGNWNMFRRDLLHTGSAGNNETVPSGTLKWSYQTGAKIHSSPAVVDGTVYVGSQDTNLYAFDADSGDVRWKFQTGSWVSSSPAVVDGYVYFGSNDSYLYALEADTGNMVWNFDTPYPVRSSPAVDNAGTVYFGGDDYHIYALDTETGEQKWRHNTGSPGGSSPVIEEGILYYGSSSGFSFALNAKDGWQRLRYQTVYSVISSAVVYDDVVYFITTNGIISAVDDLARTWLWEHDFTPYWTQLWVMLDWIPKPPAQSGYLWTLPLRRPVPNTPSIQDGIMYVGAGSSMIALDLESKEILWEYDSGDSIYSSPAVTENMVYFGSNNGNVYAVDITNGQEVWQFKTGGPVTSSPAVVDGVVYIGSDDGVLYAIE